MSTKNTSNEIFAKSFSCYSCCVVAVWLMREYEYSEFLESLHPVLMFLLGMPTVAPVVFGVMLGGIGSVIGVLCITLEYFNSLDPDRQETRWYYQIISLVATFVFSWLLYHFGATSNLF